MSGRESTVTFERALARAFALERRLENLKHRYADRDDLPGLQLLLRALALIAAELVRLIIEQQRAIALSRHAQYNSERKAIVEAASSAAALYTRPQLELLGKTHGRGFDPLVQPFVRLAREMAGREDTELIFQPTEEATYAAAFWVNESLEDLAKQAAPELKTALVRLPRLQILYYPLSGESETFQHAILAHEIAHITLRQPWSASSRLRVVDYFYIEALTELAADVGQLASDRVRANAVSSEEQLRALRLVEARRIIQRTEQWFTEVASDLLAIRVVGPAFFFALFEFVAPFGNWMKSGESHPAPAWRLRRLMPEITRFIPRAWERMALQWDNEGVQRVEPRGHAGRVVARFRDALPEDDDIHPVERRLVECAMEKLQLQLTRDERNILGQAAYDVAAFRADLELVWDCLERGIAPAERLRGRTSPRPVGSRRVEGAWSDPLDWRSILNGGWLYWLAREAAGSVPFRKAAADVDEARLEFNHHILGAIELSEIQRRAVELRGSLQMLEFRLNAVG